MKLTATFGLLKETWSAWSDDKAARLGAALAYYSVFSLAPLLMVTIGIAGLVFGEQAARGQIGAEIGSTVGEPAASAIEGMLKDARQTGSCGFATLVGLGILLFAASGVFIQLQDALNTIWKVAPMPNRGLGAMLRARLLSFVIVIGTGFLLLTSLVVSAALSALNRFLTPDALPGGAYLWQAINGVVSLGLLTVLFAMIFKLLPDTPIRWRDVWVGAAVTALLFSVGRFLIGLYLGQSSTASAFGAASSLVLILLWVYYSAQIFLFGAEFTRVWSSQASAKSAAELFSSNGPAPARLSQKAARGMPISER